MTTITLDTVELKAALTAAAKVADRGHRSASLTHMAVTSVDCALTISTTDIETHYETTIAADCDGDRSTIVTAVHPLSDVIGRCPGDHTTITPGEGHIEITSGRWKVRLPTSPLDEYAGYLPPAVDTNGVTLDGGHILVRMRSVARSASTKTNRPLLAAVRFEPSATGLHIVATDSYRLSARHYPGDEIVDEPANLPATVIGLVAAAHTDGDDVTIHTSANLVRFATGGTAITSRLVEGGYPNWRQLLDSSQTKRGPGLITIDDPGALAKAAARAARFGGESGLVTLELAETGITIASRSADVGESTELTDASWSGPSRAITFNATFLAEAVTGFGSGPVVATLGEEDVQPALFRPAADPDGEDIHLLMPVRTL